METGYVRYGMQRSVFQSLIDELENDHTEDVPSSPRNGFEKSVRDIVKNEDSQAVIVVLSMRICDDQDMMEEWYDYLQNKSIQFQKQVEKLDQKLQKIPYD